MDAAPTLLEAPPKPVASSPRGPGRKVRGAAGLGAWTALACALLVASGFLRIWQAKRLEFSTVKVGRPPFALKSLSPTLGKWKILTGTDRNLAPEVAQVSGCTEHLIRDYVDSDTGVVVTLLVGYGPAELVHCHSPEACFPAAGFLPIGDSIDTDIRWDDGKGSARVRSGVYDSTTGLGQGVRYEAYYSLRHLGRWYPEAVYKTFRKEPAMYRMLVQRRVLATERREPGNPSEQFLKVLLPELEHRIAEATPVPAPAPAR